MAGTGIFPTRGQGQKSRENDITVDDNTLCGGSIEIIAFPPS